MSIRRRHRRGFYPLAQPSPLPSMARRVIVLIVAGIIIFLIGTKILSLFGVGNVVQQNAVRLTTEGQGIVKVSIEGEELKRAENNINLYPQDRVHTSARSYASLYLFDDSIIRLDEQSEVGIVKSALGAKKSEWELEMVNGSVWLATPIKDIFTGSIIRTIRTDRLLMEFPAQTEAMVGTNSLAVFSADMLGVKVITVGSKEPIFIGEGQKLVLTDELTIGDPYKYRDPLDPTVIKSPFLEESRIVLSKIKSEIEKEDSEKEPVVDEILLVKEPKDGITVQTGTVRVSGSVGLNVKSVRINGYVVKLEEGQRTFSQELALSDEDQTSVLIEALSSDEQVLAETRRLVKRDTQPPEPPIITFPASDGETYLTSIGDLEVTGRAGKDIVGIEVNDYRLQLYQPGDDTWTYLASTKLDNFKEGENVFKIVAINKGGYKSEPAVLTVILGEGEEGVIKESPSSAKATEGREDAEESEEEESEALDNFPLLPGTLTVKGPTPGTTHTATGSSFLLEGETVAQTESVWINDYKLRLYKPGKTFWNYIADTKMGTLHRGTNVYRIVSRDKDGNILDEIEYIVRFDPRSEP